MQVAMRRLVLPGRTVIGVDPDQWTVLHGSHPFLEMDSANAKFALLSAWEFVPDRSVNPLA